MESKQVTESVIARLMGFNEISQPSEPVCRPRRVLSEDYLRKSDSICLLERQSYRKRRLSKVNSETGTRIVNSVEVQGREKLHRRNSMNSVKQGETNLRVEMCRAAYSPSNIVIFRKILGNSKSEMILDSFSARKANNPLLKKWRKCTKCSASTRQSKEEIQNRFTIDKLGSRSEKGNYDDKTEGFKIFNCAHSCIDLKYERATRETTATPDTHGKSSEKNQGFEIFGENLKKFSEYSEKKHFEQPRCALDTNDELCSYISDHVLSGKKLSTSSSCPNIDPEFHLRFGEYYSPSPNSVLDTLFSKDMSSSLDIFAGIGADPNGLQSQLQLLKSELEETHSEGHEMIVSTDEDSGDESVDCHNENSTFFQLFRAEDFRDSSYLADVIEEASSFCTNANFGSKAWYSLDFPLNPSLFEMLEKKYGTNSSWDKSERKLLFDSVNLGLRDILYTSVGVFASSKPSGICFKLSQSREVIEDELWRFLLSQKNGVNRTLSEKALGTETKWFDLCDDIDFIVCEIEHILFQELSAELLYD